MIMILSQDDHILRFRLTRSHSFKHGLTLLLNDPEVRAI